MQSGGPCLFIRFFSWLGTALTTGFGNQCRGSAVASYSATLEVDGKIMSISAMQVYKNISHEELRSEDYVSNKGFTFPIQNQGSAFQQSNSHFVPGFSITSSPSIWSTSSSSGRIPSWSPPTTSGFHLTTTSASSNSSISGVATSSGSKGTTTIESTTFKQHHGSGVTPYRATADAFDYIQSISAMPIYKDKSHEELRFEDYKQCNKGNISNPSPFKNSYNTFPSAPSSNQSSPNFLFQPSKSNIWAPKTGYFTSLSNITSTAPMLSPSLNPFSPTNFFSSQSHLSIPQQSNTTSTAPTLFPSVNSFSTNLYPSQSQLSNPQPSSTTSTAPTISPSVNLFSFTNLYPSQSQLSNSPPVNPFSPPNLYSSQPQLFNRKPSAVSYMPTFTPNLNPSASIPLSESMPANSNESPKISSLITIPSGGTFSWSKPSVTLSPSIEPTSVTSLDSWPFTLNAPNHGPTVEQADYVSTKFCSQSSQAPRQHGISSLPVLNNLSFNRRASITRIRHVSSRLPPLSAQRSSCETKVPFFIDEVDKPGPISPFQPRENPMDWVQNSLSVHSNSIGKDQENDENSTAWTNDTSIQEEDLSSTQNQHQGNVDAVTETHEADVSAIMPKIPNGEYYTEPSIEELAAKEMAEPGYCSRVKEFVVGRRGYGSIMFVGETDIRHLDLESIVQFNNREVIVYLDERRKPPVGQGLNKPAEVTIRNVKCICKKTGRHHVQGRQVDNYKEMLMKKTSEQGAEFVSYDPLQGVWKFRVQHF